MSPVTLCGTCGSPIPGDREARWAEITTWIRSLTEDDRALIRPLLAKKLRELTDKTLSICLTCAKAVLEGAKEPTH